MAVNRTDLFANLGNTVDSTGKASAGTSATWSASVPFKRADAVPLEKYSLFPTLTDAQNYASKNPVSYPGQFVAVVAVGESGTAGTVTPYIIKQDGSLDTLATQEWARELIGHPFSIEKVESYEALVRKTDKNEHCIYLVPNGDTSGQDIYDEYIWIREGDRLEKIGTTRIDLSNYYTKTEVDGRLSSKADETALTGLGAKVGVDYIPVGSTVMAEVEKKAPLTRVTAIEENKLDKADVVKPTSEATVGQAADAKHTYDLLEGKVDKETGKGLSTNDYTTDDKNKLDGIAEGANKVTVSETAANGLAMTAGGELSLTVDAALSESSSRPVANSVVKAAIDLKADATDLDDYIPEADLQDELNDETKPVTSHAVNVVVGQINTLLDELNGEAL